MFLISALLLLTALHHSGVQAQFLNCDWIKSLNCATYTPGVVCGSDGNDYANMCYLSKAQCSDSAIRTLGEGTCASNGYKSSGYTTPTCSWGSWLPWDCSCCGGYIDKTVYRVRALCCEESVCTKLRVDAVKVTSIRLNYQQQGTCDKNCPSQFGSHHGNMCFPKMPTLEEIAWPNMSQSCLSVCLDIISTTTTIVPTNRPSTSRATRSTATVSQATSDPLHVICDLVSHSHCHTDVEPVCGSNNRTYINTFGILLQVLLFKDIYGQFPFPTPLDCNYIVHEPCFLYGPGKTCGSDGHDYFNRCRLAQAWCSNPLISIIGDGSCADIGYTRPYITTRPTTQESIRTTTLETTQTISPTVVKSATSNPLSLICSTLPHLSCPKDIEPVCGSDEKTYINRCEFNKEVCQHHDLTFKYRVAKTKGMYSKSVSFWATVLIASCRLVTADVCSYIQTKDCAFVPDIQSVCGTNGITYRNNCFLTKAYCHDNTIHKAHDGPCTATVTTTTTTTTAAATTDPLSVICGAMDHVHCANDVEPVCGSDGRSYVNSCEFNKEVCLRHDLTIKHIGFC